MSLEAGKMEGSVPTLITVQWLKKMFLNRGAIKLLRAKCAENL